ncbi:hypothetical protein [Streptomyces sp. NPDC056291]|uniref:hypothetical protein n=1 Tax=Streptomyces sp. NPDC056291 TaxID=3345772 RepID=UPI0035DEFBD2
MKRVVKFTGILEYDPDDYTADPEECVDLALTNGDKHAGYYLFHTGTMEVTDFHGQRPGE